MFHATRRLAAAASNTVQNLFNVGPTTLLYNKPMAAFHWIMAAGLVTSTGAAIYAQRLNPLTDKVARDRWMLLHESTGLLMAIVLIPRLMTRLFSRLPAQPPGPAWLALITGFTAQHGIYGLVSLVAVTGIALEFFRGKDIPLIGSMKLPGAKQSWISPNFANRMQDWHRWTGRIFEIVVPMHVGLAVLTYFKGFNLISRMWPFSADAHVKAQKMARAADEVRKAG